MNQNGDESDERDELGEEPAKEVKRRSESDKVAGGERNTGRSKQREEEENGGHQSAPVR